VTEAEVVDFTPELHSKAMAILAKYNYGPLFTPESLQKPTIEMPGIAGGASWSGAGCDPETGICYVSSVTLPYTATLVPSSVPNTGYIGKMAPVETINGVPLWKPPYGRVTAIDLNSGEHRWMTPSGDLAEEVPALTQLGLHDLGRPARGHLLLTKSLLVIGQEGSTHREGGPEQVPKFQVIHPNLTALDKSTGKRVAEVALPRNATAAPMTYLHKGKQFLVVATGGANLPAELVAFTL
jgi:quinoprotein glucose dehydrogenase